ncbi:MAG: peptide chain release factor N(5)-glutamine methyltransferase [Acidimicrobiales bacterium]|nr:peptide chain release factor N(5)-glutamine methyltransferase [Acidimicrobiales bacterium]
MTGGAEEEGTPWRVFAAEAVARLEAAGVESPEVSVRRIVERAAGFDGAEYALGLSEPATERAMGFFDAMVERRLAGEPLQYVLGEWSFRTLDLMVDRRVLIPRPETEQVVEVALAELDALGPEAPRVVDLGTGSGAIALSVAVECPAARVWAGDVSSDALAVARANLAGIGHAGTRVTLVQGSWFEALPRELQCTLDLVVSNPPYVAASDPLPAEVADWEPAGALVPGPTGLEAIEEIVAGAPVWLRRPGALVVELAPSQADDAVILARAAGFTDARVAPDLTGRPRALVARIG